MVDLHGYPADLDKAGYWLSKFICITCDETKLTGLVLNNYVQVEIFR